MLWASVLSGKKIGSNSIDIAENGQHALEYLKQTTSHNPYSLILMDCQMPVMDAVEQRVDQHEAGHARRRLDPERQTADRARQPLQLHEKDEELELILLQRVWATVDTMLQRCLKERGRKY